MLSLFLYIFFDFIFISLLLSVIIHVFIYIHVIQKSIINKKISSEVLKLKSMNIKMHKNSCMDKTSYHKKFYSSILWSFNNIRIEINRFILIGILFAAVLIIIALLRYSSNTKLVSIIGIIPVHSLWHISFIAVLIFSMASPYTSIIGVAENIYKLISMYKLIDKRALIIYIVSMLFFGILIGYITNILLSDHFTPIFYLSNSQKQIEIANNIFPNWFKNSCVIIFLFMSLYTWFIIFIKKLNSKKTISMLKILYFDIFRL